MKLRHYINSFCRMTFSSWNDYLPQVVFSLLRLEINVSFSIRKSICKSFLDLNVTLSWLAIPWSESSCIWESWSLASDVDLFWILMDSSDSADKFWSLEIALFRVRTSRAYFLFRCFWYFVVLLRVRLSWTCLHFRCFWSFDNLYLILFCIWWHHQISSFFL